MSEPIPLAVQIACVKRELALRGRVYPRWVAEGRMKLDAAEREQATLAAVLKTLTDLQENDGGQPELL